MEQALEMFLDPATPAALAAVAPILCIAALIKLRALLKETEGRLEALDVGQAELATLVARQADLKAKAERDRVKWRQVERRPARAVERKAAVNRVAPLPAGAETMIQPLRKTVH